MNYNVTTYGKARQEWETILVAYILNFIIAFFSNNKSKFLFGKETSEYILETSGDNELKVLVDVHFLNIT